MKKLNIPKPNQFSSTDRFKRTKDKHVLRVFPFSHNGEDHLAAVEQVHFAEGGGAPIECTGANCETCAEANRTENRRLRKVTRYPVVVVDMEGDKNKPLRFDMPSSAYNQLAIQVSDTGDDVVIMGNNGRDVTLRYDKNASPSAQYQLSFGLKPGEKLAVKDADIPDLIADIESFRSGVVRNDADHPADEEPAANMVYFKIKGKEMAGVNTGKKRDGKCLIEVDGRIIPVAEKDLQEMPF